MANKKTSKRKASRTTSRAVGYKRTTSTKKKLNKDEFSRKARALKRYGVEVEGRGKDVVSPKSASAIRKEVRVTSRDRKVARKAMSRA